MTPEFPLRALPDLAVRLAPAVHESAGIRAHFIRHEPDEWRATPQDHDIGFVFSHVADREASVGSDAVVRRPLEPGLGWVILAGCDGYSRWGETSAYLSLSFDPGRFANPGRALFPRQNVIDPTTIALALRTFTLGDATDDIDAMQRESAGLALWRHAVLEYGLPADRPPLRFDHRLQRAAELIRDEYRRRIGLDDLAVVAGVSRFHFAKAFKLQFGVPPHAYLLQRRLDEACHLLAHSNRPIKSVANLAGFSGPHAMIRAFQRAFGCTPGAWRDMRR